MKILRIQPWPWWVELRQYDGFTHKSSRPRIMDAKGKPVRLSNVRQATLMAMAPVLLDRLAGLADWAEMAHLQLQSALSLNLPKPVALARADEILLLARRA